MTIFALYNLKGGVGKTAAAVALAYLSARDGARTLIWDLDPQGAATYCFRVRADIEGGAKRLMAKRRRLRGVIRGTDIDGLDLVPADFSLRRLDIVLDARKRPRRRVTRMLELLEPDYDNVFLDCPPSMSLASEAVFAAADVLLVPTMPTPLSQRTLEQLAGFLERKGPQGLEVLPFYSMVDRRKALHRQTCESPDGLAYRPLSVRIPYASAVEQTVTYRSLAPLFGRDGEAGRAFRALWEEVKQRLADRPA
ncbi:MAG: AAA family ATPase [Acidobacteriota bacterium]|nr:MAG: AAA family ATPase [Acidobacteriota bacterium]